MILNDSSLNWIGGIWVYQIYTNKQVLRIIGHKAIKMLKKLVVRLLYRYVICGVWRRRKWKYSANLNVYSWSQSRLISFHPIFITISQGHAKIFIIYVHALINERPTLKYLIYGHLKIKHFSYRCRKSRSSTRDHEEYSGIIIGIYQ